MKDTGELYVIDLYSKDKGLRAYKGYFAIDKNIYLDDGEIYYYGFDLDEAI